MYKKNSVLDRKLRPGSYRPNLESQDQQYEAEQNKLKGKQQIYTNNEERVRKCYDPTDEEKVDGERNTYGYMQEALAVKEQQRREEEEERRRVVEYDYGYRNYTGGALPWQERANPFSGSEEYERYLKREYLRGMMEENQRMEFETKAYKQYEVDATKDFEKDLLREKNFWNKDLDNDKWWYKANQGYHRGAGEYSTQIGHHIHHHQYNSWLNDPSEIPPTTYKANADRTWGNTEEVAQATVRPTTAAPTYPWATHE